MPLNKQDLKLIKTVVKDVLKESLVGFAKKDDLNGFAKKTDLKNFATKDDLKKLESRMASKEDLNNFKIEITETIDELRIDTANGFKATQEQLDNHTKRFEKIDGQLIELKTEQENIKLRVGQLAPNFEIRELKKRVQKIEEKVGIE